MSELQIRPIRTTELDELIDLLCVVHENTQRGERYRSYILGDPTWRPEQTPVVLVDDRIVSTLRIWDRHVHLGATPVRMGGIGGVTTHPDYRRRGLANQLMAHAAETMRSSGYELGLLFTIIPERFYRRLGWCSVPLTGFRATLHQCPDSACGPWVVPFEAARDLEEVVTLYQRNNAGCSGTLLRPRPYWDYTPSQVRGVLPTVVARDSMGLVGYLNWEMKSDRAYVNEVAWANPPSLQALVLHLLAECDAAAVTEVYGGIPPGHAFVDALVVTAEADLRHTGDGSMMALPLDMSSLIDKVLPRAPQEIRRLPADLLCRLLFGESSAGELIPVLHSRGIEPDIPRRLEELCPRRELIFWQPDHF